ncbi:peptidase M16 [Mucilaginibacter sp. PPCGB 2223]|uniref:M16 family metallopeptidase n=1 Tax=Mucilaginibacter sp. PPCGB 2223 TaxID=1886027 RepID=UPI000825DB1E|nr:M16 family metallopeptidase [Mucilaginibacter sp. PPCGB 2223]OCX53661.1 peptidase M16 [Mucilaginibacter sp. PPCGB 2223]
MKIKYLFAAVLLSLSVTVMAQKTGFVWKTATSGGYTYKYVSGDPTHSRFYVLKNGLTVMLSPTAKEPRIQCYVAVKAGSKTDPSDHTGLAHYLEHMMFKGTDKYGSLDWAKEKPLLDQIDALYEQYNSTTDTAKRRAIYAQIDEVSGKAAKFAIANEYDKMMASMGGQGTNAFTSLEETVYTDDIPSSAVDKYLTLQAERFRKPVLRLFHTELEAVYEEKNRGLDNDGEKVFESLYAAIFPNNNYGKQTTIGTVEHLKNPSLNHIRNYYYTYYVPNNMGVIMSGDFNPDVMIKKIDQKFAYMKAKPVPPYTFTPEKPITSPIQRDVYGPNPENLTIGFRFGGAPTHDADMLTLVSQILSNGKAGLIDLDLTKKQKLLSARAGADINKDYSVLTLTGQPIKGQSLDDVKALLLAELDKLRKGEFSDDLLASIINNFKKSVIQQNESYTSRANNLMNDFVTGVDWRRDVANVSDLSKVTKAQIVAYANKTLNDNNYVIVYKHQGEDKNIVKVDKPHITPVEVNREAQSPFLKMVNDIPANNVKPVWLDYDKDIQKAKIGSVDLLSVQNKDNSIFRLYYRYNMGSWNNKLFSLAAQYLQYLGTDKMTSEDVSKQFYKLASGFNTSTTGEVTTISMNGLQENFAKTVALYEDLIANCKPDEAVLASLKVRLKKSRENAKLNKGSIMQGLVSYAMYGEKNPFNNVLSDAELDAVKADDLVAILHDLVNYNHTVLYYGPLTAQQAAVALKPLHKIPASFKPYPQAQVFTKVNQEKPQVLFANYDMVQAEIDWIRNSDSYTSDMTPSVELFNNYYGGGMNAVVFQTIRESKALAYSTYAFYSQPVKKDDRYVIQAYVGTQADKFNEAIKSMNELLTDLPESQKIVTSAKDNIRKSLETERITQDGILFNYLAAKRLGVNYDIRKNTFDAIDKMGFEDIKKFHDKELKDKPYTYCVVASEKRVSDDDLKKYGELKKLSLKEIFGY